MKNLTPYQKKAIDFTKHISLTANAGSGKTFVLSNRFVEIALNLNIPLNSIVAITFTEKAAGELYRKISNEIDDRIDCADNDIIKKKLEDIRRQLVFSNISTIHSFCINILKEFSPEAGIDANFLPADQNKSDELIELSIEEIFKITDYKSDLNESVKSLIRYFGSKSMLIEQLKNLLKNKKNILEIEKNIYNKSDDEIAKFFEDKFREKIKHIFPHFEKFLTAITNINNRVKGKTVNDNTISIDNNLKSIRDLDIGAEQMLRVLDIRNIILTNNGGIRSVKYLSKKMRNGLETEMEFIISFYNEFDKLKYTDVDVEINKGLVLFGKLIIKIFNVLLSIYESKKKNLSLLDFEDLLLKTRDVLKNDFVRTQLNQKYRFIMVDEYQDTNEIQYDIIMPILKYLGEGNLFIVGDEKQSIYRFRDAEPEIFRRTTKEILNNKQKGEYLNLPHSFRVAPSIAFFVNKIFGELFSNYDPEYNEVKYDNLLCGRDEHETGNVEFLLHDEENEDYPESELLAQKIIQLTKDSSHNQADFSNIAILCRKRSAFMEIEKSFIQNKIPYTITSGKGFFQNQTIYDIYNFISFILNPDDDIALFGILRAPFYSYPDTRLFEISLERGKTFLDKLKSFSAKEKSYKRAFDQLMGFVDFGSSASILALLRKILVETGYWSVVAAKSNAKQEIANIEKFLHMANNFSKQGFRTLYDFKEYLAESIDKVEDESQAVINEDDNSVKIMTIHQAKGLEFDTIFLYKCNDSAQSEAVKSKKIYVDKNFGIMAKIPKDHDYFKPYGSAPIVSIYNYEASRKAKAEIKRLLYVGITRSINNLFITATFKKNKFKEDSFLQLLASALKTDFSDPAIYLTGKLQYMKSDEYDYETYYGDINLKIPITNQIDIKDKSEYQTGSFESVKKKLLTDNVVDYENEEIISATKIAYFKQCPVKYQLTYEFGYSKLKKLIQPEGNNFEELFKEDVEDYLPADIKGRVIHSLLEQEINIEDSEFYIRQMLEGEFQIPDSENRMTNYCKDIKSLSKKYYNSSTYKELNNYSNFNNEFEIYSKFKDYYLYGIIDKIIIEEDKIIIVDYKTDNVEENQIIKKSENYLPQLMFYALIAGKIFKEPRKINLELIFLNQPESPVRKSVSKQELDSYSEEIDDIVSKIREKRFVPNLNHCRQCHFADSNYLCPIKFSQTENNGQK